MKIIIGKELIDCEITKHLLEEITEYAVKRET